MKATVYVAPKVTAGLERGGEGLELVFECVVDGTDVPTEFECELDISDDTSGYNVEVDEELAAEHEENHTRYNGPVTYTTWHYEHKWTGTQETALALVKDRLANKDAWHYCGQAGGPVKLCFEWDHFVDDNAE